MRSLILFPLAALVLRGITSDKSMKVQEESQNSSLAQLN